MITLKKNSLKYKDENGNMQDSGVLFGHNETDITLTKSGIAADAKVVGEEINQLSQEIDDLQTALIGVSELIGGEE